MINKQPDLLTQEHCCDDGESRVGNLDHNWQSLTTETQTCPAELRGGGYNEGDHYQVWNDPSVGEWWITLAPWSCPWSPPPSHSNIALQNICVHHLDVSMNCINKQNNSVLSCVQWCKCCIFSCKGVDFFTFLLCRNKIYLDTLDDRETAPTPNILEFDIYQAM